MRSPYRDVTDEKLWSVLISALIAWSVDWVVSVSDALPCSWSALTISASRISIICWTIDAKESLFKAMWTFLDEACKVQPAEPEIHSVSDERSISRTERGVSYFPRFSLSHSKRTSKRSPIWTRRSVKALERKFQVSLRFSLSWSCALTASETIAAS